MEITMCPDNNHEPVNFKFAHDRAAVLANVVVAIVRDWIDEPELRVRIAAYLRDEFHDLVAQVFSESRPD
jgi:hypothetical protein